MQNGFQNVNQLQGGIIQYAHEVKERLESKFIGKNFVFDERLGERVTEDIISFCHICKSLAITTLIVRMMLAIFYLFSVIDVLKC